jgi:HAD superfamily phosphatase (TIGR01668 family)
VRPLLAPSIVADAIWEIDLASLRAAGVRGLILDLDNTLVDWNRNEIRPQVRQWLEAARRLSMRVSLVSNAIRGGRVSRIGAELDLLVVTWALKPLPWGFRRAMALMGTEPASTCAIGDQVFTDMLGANLVGIRTVLLAPLSPRESPHTRLIRLIERPLRRRWARRRPAPGQSSATRPLP